VPYARAEKRLNLTWQQLRGVHNGLARICDTAGAEKPIRTAGYNAENRQYHLTPSDANTIRVLGQREEVL
jgi:hypothetical protein